MRNITITTYIRIYRYNYIWMFDNIRVMRMLLFWAGRKPGLASAGRVKGIFGPEKENCYPRFTPSRAAH